MGDNDGQGFAPQRLVGDRPVLGHHSFRNLLHQVPCKINPGVLASQENGKGVRDQDQVANTASTCVGLDLA